ncbi:hypothetical protein [Pelagicoccus sp. SDUM812003]|uniref:hypothetical protein n=1 Tax=Pelagicoccus sp. SDUM812003 TaxID=3041267 RepID=UPI00281018E4|nr:hypothetical protein [Pelagicoccus sp. SDUM812003]MDQ8203700.1 hypothetical protein [Pelagicoccus sp. SDUM812003]
MHCSLLCPACGNREQLGRRKGDRTMPLSLLERVLSGFRREGYSIDYVEWAGQGDPLLHSDFSKLSGLVRHYYPKTRQRVITNANYDFQRTIGVSFVEDIVVS